MVVAAVDARAGFLVLWLMLLMPRVIAPVARSSSCAYSVRAPS